MAGSLSMYAEVAKRSFRRYSTYRGATFAGVFTNTVFGFVQAYVLLAVFRQRENVGGFDATDALTYTFLVQGLLAALSAFSPLELADRIPTGDVVSDLYRPLDLQAWWLAQDFGRAAFHAVFRGIPPFVVGAIAFHLRLPADAGVWVVSGVAFVLAVALSFAWRFIVALTAFWLLDIRGLWQLTAFASLFFSGFILPLPFFPPVLRDVAEALPFSAIVQVPVEVFLSKHRGVGDVAAVLGRQLGWLAVLVVAGRVVLGRAWHRVVVQGG